MVKKAADALDLQGLRDDFAKLRQEVLAHNRAARGGHQQDGQQEVLAWKSACSAFLALPGLRGFWPMSSFDENGDAFDMSEQDRVLTYNGNPTYNYDGLAPYIDLDGTGDYLSRADEAGLDILGTETYVAAAIRGLTVGAWLHPNETGTFEMPISKWAAAGQRSWRVAVGAGDAFAMTFSDDGTNSDTVNSAAITIGNWYFVVGRILPAASVDVVVDGVVYTQATVRASVFNSNASFVIGAGSAGGSEFEGRVSLCFLCTCALSDAQIHALYHQTRGLFRKW